MALAVSARLGCANLTSDNTAGVMPEVLAAVVEASKGTAPAYGNDVYTKRLNTLFSQVFETKCEVFAVSTGTAANSLALASVCKPWSAVLCHAGSHIHVDEAGACEAASGGAKLIPIDGPDSKLTAESLRAQYADTTRYGDYGGVPAVVSVTQVNESGLLYSLDELKAIGAFAKEKKLVMHMDGARFGNAVEGIGCSPADMTWRSGVDVLSFGATKNGCMAAEAVVFFKPGLSTDARLRVKRGGHMLSKMRFLSAQLVGYLGDPSAGPDAPWRKGARHGNAMAKKLASAIQAIAKEAGLQATLKMLQPVQSNEVFFALPEHVLSGVFADGHACLDIGALSNSKRPGELMRCVCSWATVEVELDAFIASIRKHAAARTEADTSASTKVGASHMEAISGGDDSVDAAPTDDLTDVPVWPGLDNVPAGTKGVFRHLIVQLPGREDAPESAWLPIFCVRGTDAKGKGGGGGGGKGVGDGDRGSVLLTLAGVHGDEFEPMAASQDLFASLNPAELTGTWLCIACAGIAGYLVADRRAPDDSKNLARCFPGDKAGTYTERAAYTITKDFFALPEVSAIIDLHSAGKVARMVTMAGYNMYREYLSDDEAKPLADSDKALNQASQALARAMAMPLVWGHHCDPSVCEMSALNDERGSRTSLYGAYLHRKPAAYCETTGTGGIDERDVITYVEGVKRALAYLSIIPTGHHSLSKGVVKLDTVDPHPLQTNKQTNPAAWSPAGAGAGAVTAGLPADQKDKASSGHLQSQNCTPVAGLWRARVALWEKVKQGDIVGTVTNHFGEELYQVNAQKSGTIILLRHLARVESGDFLVVVV